jgi:thiol-disulfide isomerase/thioredoxin
MKILHCEWINDYFCREILVMISRIDSADGLKEIVFNAENLLVYFFNDDCAPCISLRPKVEELILNRFPLMDLVYVNARQFPELISEYNAYSYPVLIFFFEGKEYLRYSKYVSLSELSESIGRIYDLYHLPD